MRVIYLTSILLRTASYTSYWLHEPTLTCLRFGEICSVSVELLREVTQCDYCEEKNTQKPANKEDRVLLDFRI
jgi:hypothetical protein